MKRKSICMLMLCGMMAVQSVTVCASLGDMEGYTVVEDYQTARSSESSCVLSVQAVCPDGFEKNVYVLLTDDEGSV